MASIGDPIMAIAPKFSELMSKYLRKQTDTFYDSTLQTNPCDEKSFSSSGGNALYSHTEHIPWKTPDPSSSAAEALTTTTTNDGTYTYTNVKQHVDTKQLEQLDSCSELDSCSVCRDGDGFMFNSGGVCERCERTLPATQVDWLDLVGKLLAGATIGVKDEEAIKKARQLLALIPLKELIREEAIAVA